MNTVLATRASAASSHGDTRKFLRVFDNTLLFASCAVLFLAPLCFGAVQYWAVFALQLSATGLLALWAARQFANRELVIFPNVLYFPMMVFAAFALIQWATGITAYRYATYSQLLVNIAYGMLAFVVTQSLRRSSQLKPLAWTICLYGGVVSCLALLQGLIPNGKLLWIWSIQHGGLIYGSYVNHNHYAGLMELLVPFPLALALSHFTNGSRKLIVAAVGSVMAATIFLSGSRGGVVAFLAQIAVLGLLLRRSRQKTSWKQLAPLAALLILVVAALFWLGSNELTHRLASLQAEARQEVSGGTRLTIDRDALRMWTKRPLLGWGLGTFPEVYPQFRSFFSEFFLNQAHNDYLQLLVETGLAGFVIALWFLSLLFRSAIRKLDSWTEREDGVLTTAALVACVGILVHGFVDFNLQVPANAALFYVISAIAAAEPLQQSIRLRHVRRRTRSFFDEPGPLATGAD